MRRARDRIRDYLHEQGCEPEALDATLVAVEEAMTNAVRHSGASQDVEVSIRFEGDDLVAQVRDHGCAFDATGVDLRHMPDLSAAGGRGLFLMASLMDELDICCDGGVEIRAVKRGARPATPESRPSPAWPAPGDAAYGSARRAALLDEVDEFVIGLDWEYRYTFVNEAALRFVRHGREELIGKRLWDVVPALADRPEGQAIRDAMELGQFTTLEYRAVIGGDWVETRFYPTSTGMSVYGHEINARKRDEERLHEHQERLEADLEATRRLLNLGSTFIREADFEPVLNEIVDAGIAIAGADFGNCQLVDPGSGQLRIVGHRGLPDWWLEHWQRVAEGCGTCGAALAHGERVIVEDVTESPVFVGTPDLDVQLRAGIRAVVSTPLVGRSGRPLGIVSQHFGRPHRPDDRTLRLLDLLAVQAGDIIERWQAEEALTRSAEALRESEERVRLLHETMLQGVVFQDAGGMITSMNPAAERILGKRPGEFLGSSSIGEERCTLREDGTPFPGLEHPAMVSLRTGEPVADVRMRVFNPRESRYRLIAVDAVPLRRPGEGTPSGVYTVFDDITEQERAEQALRESEERLRGIADQLQEALLTMPEQVPGIELAQAYRPASDAARVGGDFYDVFELHYGQVAIVIGDVAGKGLDAAVLTSMIRHTLRAHAFERGKTPAQICALTNELVCAATHDDTFATVFFGILDCRDGRLVYVNAGHTTALLRRRDGLTRLPVTGPLLGAFDGVGFEQAETHLEPGELLFLYTDGLTDARGEGQFYGEERLFGLLNGSGDRSARQIVDDVLGDITAFSGGRLRDDLAVLAVRRLEQGATEPRQQKLRV